MRGEFRQIVEELPEHLRKEFVGARTLEQWVLNHVKIAYQSGLRHKRMPLKSPETFNAFYAAYPRKVGRAAAERVWMRMTPKNFLIQKIMSDIERRKKGDWKDKDKQFIPHPATYLNQRRWEDESDEEPSKDRSLIW